MRELLVRSGAPENFGSNLEDLVPDHLMGLARSDVKRSIPAIARDAEATAGIGRLLKEVPTTHRLLLGD